MVIKANNLYGSQDPCILTVLTCFVRLNINLANGRIATGKFLSESILSFVNRNTDRWTANYFTNGECAAKETSVDVFYTSLPLHDSVALFYCGSISNSHIILYDQFHITNWYCNNLDHHLCTTWGTLVSDLKHFCSPL